MRRCWKRNSDKPEGDVGGLPFGARTYSIRVNVAHPEAPALGEDKPLEFISTSHIA